MPSPPKWFKVVAIIALVWNILGLLAVLADMMVTPEMVAKMTPDQQALYAAKTWWSTTASLAAVFGGSIGSLGLLLRKKWGEPFLIASLFGLIVQDIGLFVVANGMKVAGTVGIILQTIIFLIAIGLLQMARTGRRREWI